MERRDILIGLGANLGDPRAQLESAARRLIASAPTTRWRISSLYAGPYVGRGPAQPEYCNAVLLLEGAYELHEFFRRMQALQREFDGSTRAHQAPRRLDLDLLLFEDELCDEPGLQLPHPRLRERRFVLEPLVELCPELRLPPDERPARWLLAEPEIQAQRLRRVAEGASWLDLESRCLP